MDNKPCSMEITCNLPELKNALDALIRDGYNDYDFSVVWKKVKEEEK